MNRKITLLLAMAGAAALLAGCGKKDGPADYSKYVELGPYTDLSIDQVVTTISDEDVQDEVQMELSYSAEYTDVTDRAAKSGDIANIDYTGTVDGAEFDGGSEDDVDVELGSGFYLEDFENAIIGMKAGETKTFNLTFPEPYNGELDGKEAEFTVTLNSISEVKYPEYNDEYVSGISDYSTVKEYEDAIRAELQSEADEDSLNMACEDALNTVISGSTVTGYPDDLYEECKETTESENQELLDEFGFDDIQDLFGEGYDEEAMILETVNEKMVVSTLAAKEKLTITDEEFQASLEENLPYTEYESAEEFAENIDQEAYKYSLLRDKVLAFLAERNTFKKVSEEEYYSDEGGEITLDANGDDVAVIDVDADEAAEESETAATEAE